MSTHLQSSGQTHIPVINTDTTTNITYVCMVYTVYSDADIRKHVHVHASPINFALLSDERDSRYVICIIHSGKFIMKITFDINDQKQI